MISSLSGCYPKIERADRQIIELKNTIQEHLNKNPARIRQQYDEKAGVLNFIFIDQVPLPLEFNIIIGEILYQQRSALDHLVWQLVLRRRLEPPSKSGFPIFTTIDGYEARSEAMIKGVGASAGERIKSLQPFHRGADAKKDPLWMLQELNNTDKHRLLIVTRLFIGEGDSDRYFSPGIPVEKGANVMFATRCPIENGVVFMSFETKTRKTDVKANLPGEIMVKEIGVAKNEPIVPLLMQLSRHVRSIIESFEPDFT